MKIKYLFYFDESIRRVSFDSVLEKFLKSECEEDKHYFLSKTIGCICGRYKISLKELMAR